MSEGKMPNVGDVVIFHDSKGLPHNAIVICVFSPDSGSMPLLNMVMIEAEGMEDTYGRQIKRETSVIHKSNGVHGNVWRWPEESTPEYVAPSQT